MATRFVVIHSDLGHVALVCHVLHCSPRSMVEFLVLVFRRFRAAVVLALRGIRSVIGIVALLLALSSFALLFIMHLG